MTTHYATNGTYASSLKPTTALFTAGKNFPYARAGINEVFQYTPLPAGLAGKQVAQALLSVTMQYVDTATPRSLIVQRHSKPTSAGMPGVTWNNRPGALAGSTAHTVTQSPRTQTFVFDVTADLQAIANGGAYYGWRVTTTFAPESWKVYGFGSILPMKLDVTVAEAPVTPTGINPNGITSVAAPVVTWLTPGGLISAQVQVDEYGGDFTTPLFDTGVLSMTVAQVDLAAAGWAGQTAGGKVDVRVRQTTVLGTSAWSTPVTVERQTHPALTITAPASTTNDPTPAVVWSMADQTRWQVITTRDGVIIHNTGVQPGDDTAYSPPAGAVRPDQQITHEVRAWDDVVRTISPGDPGYSYATHTTTYNPGVLTPITGISAQQDGPAPWVDIVVSRANLPDEWLLIRNGDIVQRIAAISDGNPVWTLRDWACPPNTDVTYDVLPVVENIAGSSSGVIPHRSEVTGAWLFDPQSGAYIRCRGTDLALEETESVSWYEPTGAAAPTKRTFALRGFEGTIGGKLEDLTGRNLTDHLADWYAIKSAPSRTMRVAYDTHNYPVLVAGMKTAPHQALTTYKTPTKTVVFEVRQNGELPYEPVTL